LSQTTGTIEKVYTADGVKNGKAWKRYDTKLAGGDGRYSTFDESLGEAAIQAEGISGATIVWEPDGEYNGKAKYKLTGVAVPSRNGTLGTNPGDDELAEIGLREQGRQHAESDRQTRIERQSTLKMAIDSVKLLGLQELDGEPLTVSQLYDIADEFQRYVREGQLERV
jgi:hypothetical protein